MHRLFTAVITACLVVVASAPAVADDAVTDDTVTHDQVTDVAAGAAPLPCGNDQGLDVVSADGLLTDIAAPGFPLDETAQTTQLLVDLGADDAATATVRVTLSWSLTLNDFDLAGTAETGQVLSDRYQPVDIPQESITFVAGHCEVVEVTAMNFFAPLAPADTLSLAAEILSGDALDDVAGNDAPIDDADPLAADDVDADSETAAGTDPGARDDATGMGAPHGIE